MTWASCWEDRYSRTYTAGLHADLCRRKVISTRVLEDEEEEDLWPRSTRNGFSEVEYEALNVNQCTNSSAALAVASF
jgi:hypothetical protein